MFLETVVIFNVVFGTYSAATNDSYKDQYCTDPRTMKRHSAYTEWADAYSCTRHRCQPGGRNLAIYTVGCKRVEAPESAIECEEVVEDTNMQFPYCCTRLRCLVVVRGEVWTRVLGQPWETLPAAPWSHMYKMKRPPPGEDTFSTKNPTESGPVYELAVPETVDRRDNSNKLRGNKKLPSDPEPQLPQRREEADEFENNAVPRVNVAAGPDIVIALATNNDLKDHKSSEKLKKSRKHPQSQFVDDDVTPEENTNNDNEDNALAVPEKPTETENGENNFFASDNNYGVTSQPDYKTHSKAHEQVAWDEMSANKWKGDVDTENLLQPLERTVPEYNSLEKKEGKPPAPGLQALVDAIGTRMRDIEHVVHKMSEKVHQTKKAAGDDAGENRPQTDQQDDIASESKPPSYPDTGYKRFSVKSRGSKYLRSNEQSTSRPADDNSGYFSDVSNTVLRRSTDVKETDVLQPTYMAPVETRRTAHAPLEISVEEVAKKKKKHQHHKKHSKKGKKRRSDKKGERKRFNKLNVNSVEVDRTEISLEESSAQV